LSFFFFLVADEFAAVSAYVDPAREKIVRKSTFNTLVSKFGAPDGKFMDAVRVLSFSVPLACIPSTDSTLMYPQQLAQIFSVPFVELLLRFAIFTVGGVLTVRHLADTFLAGFFLNTLNCSFDQRIQNQDFIYYDWHRWTRKLCSTTTTWRMFGSACSSVGARLTCCGYREHLKQLR
jgi:hypothetical protein